MRRGTRGSRPPFAKSKGAAAHASRRAAAEHERRSGVKAASVVSELWHAAKTTQKGCHAVLRHGATFTTHSSACAPTVRIAPAWLRAQKGAAEVTA